MPIGQLMQRFFQHFSNSQIPWDKTISKTKKGQKGQLVLEFILLLIISVGLATLIRSRFIGGRPNDCETGNAPILSQTFCNFVTVIGRDLASGEEDI